jgi:hypothetical protein
MIGAKSDTFSAIDAEFACDDSFAATYRMASVGHF